MEGLIPFIYRAIVQSKNGGCTGTAPTGSLSNESPSASYMQLPDDSGRFQSMIPLLMPDLSSASTAMTTAVETPIRRSPPQSSFWLLAGSWGVSMRWLFRTPAWLIHVEGNNVFRPPRLGGGKLCLRLVVHRVLEKVITCKYLVMGLRNGGLFLFVDFSSLSLICICRLGIVEREQSSRSSFLSPI